MLVFGLASAPFVFIKVVKVLFKQWRKIGIKIFAFVNNFSGGSHNNFNNPGVVADRVRTD